MATASPVVTVVDYDEVCAIQARLAERRPPRSKDGYEIWKRYHLAIREVAERHGRFGSDDDAEFYHGNDWFHELSDGFALRTTTALNKAALKELQAVVAQHHPEATLSIGGELGTPIAHLTILIAPSAICAAWFESKAAGCRARIKEAGVGIL